MSGARSQEPAPGRGRCPPSAARCGEATSNKQGEAAGVPDTAERVLGEQFGLDAPSWLPADYELGP